MNSRLRTRRAAGRISRLVGAIDHEAYERGRARGATVAFGMHPDELRFTTTEQALRRDHKGEGNPQDNSYTRGFRDGYNEAKRDVGLEQTRRLTEE